MLETVEIFNTFIKAFDEKHVGDGRNIIHYYQSLWWLTCWRRWRYLTLLSKHLMKNMLETVETLYTFTKASAGKYRVGYVS